MQRIFLADKSQRVQENTAEKPPAAEMAAKAVEDEATFAGVRRVTADDAQADQDEVIANMVSEGGPNC